MIPTPTLRVCLPQNFAREVLIDLGVARNVFHPLPVGPHVVVGSVPQENPPELPELVFQLAAFH